MRKASFQSNLKRLADALPGWKEGDLINQDWLDKHIVDMLTYQGGNYLLIMDELHFKQDTNQRVIPNQFLLRSVFWK